ncbi:hypothetical protein RMATCC62417_10085 [Rhizopus microsporus]|nr:hypothetical protein RMATCC62417_10085 [Rhizopus microsporus]
MKLNICRLATVIAVASVFLCGTSYGKETLVEDYFEPKHVMFMSTFGGSSHVNWVLSILNELSKRGHRITYVTREIQAKHAKQYPHFNTVILKGKETNMEGAFAQKHTAILDAAGTLLKSGYHDFKSDYTALRHMIKTENISAAVCGFATAPGCFEAARDSNIPYILTSSYAAFPDASAAYINNHVLTMENPTTYGLSFFKRFYDMFVIPVQAYLQMKPVGDWINERRREAGCNIRDLEYEPWTHKNNIKLVNSLFGIEAARPFGPLVERVGPIMQRQYDPLTPDLKEYLDSHSRILYIAFGQHAVASISDLQMIMTSVMENVERGVYDGFLWASRKSSETFPEEIKTSSGKIYRVKDMFEGKYSNLRFVSWAPQTAVLFHPSVNVFLTHGGAGSMYEALYAGKRLVVFPFYGDQFLNAQNVKATGLGDFLNPTLSQEEANDMVKRVGLDIDGSIQQNVKRYKALIQIHSRNGSIRGADIIEEVLFVNKDAYLPYRYPVSRQMSFIKARNLDLIAAALVLFMGIVYSFVLLVKAAFHLMLAYIWQKEAPIDPAKIKLKTI